MDLVRIIAFIVVALINGSKQMEEIKAILEKYPSWSFEVVSVDSLLEQGLQTLKASGQNDISEDILRQKIMNTFGPDMKYAIKKTYDPKWVKHPPANFDARDRFRECKHLIETVDDEGACLTDSPVVVASVASDRYCIFTNGTHKDALSSEWLTACAEWCTIGRPYSLRSLRYIFSDGIVTGSSFNSRKGCLPFTEEPCKHVLTNDTMSSGHPVVSKKKKMKTCDKYLPYDHECPKKCSNKKYSRSLDKDKIFMTTYFYTNNEWIVKNEIMNYGPMASSILLYSDFYNHKTTNEGFYWRSNQSTFVAADKFFKIIGWGTENGVKYWLCVNSWSEWGANKVFKILRGANYMWCEWMMTTGVFCDLN